MRRSLHLTRSHAILRIKRRLEQDSFPRIQMSLIVGLTKTRQRGQVFGNAIRYCKT